MLFCFNSNVHNPKNDIGHPLIGSKTLPLLFEKPHPVVIGCAVYLSFVLASFLLVFFYINREEPKNELIGFPRPFSFI